MALGERHAAWLAWTAFGLTAAMVVAIAVFVELDAVSFELSAVTRETMQPAYISLWLRPEAGR